MLDSIFRGVFDAAHINVIPVDKFLLCVGVALVLGGLIAFLASRAAQLTHSFLTALAVLPALVSVTIMMVNGNIGAGVATAGTFTLVRFRSAAGSAREMALIFLSMAVGIMVGMGYLAYAALLAVVIAVVVVVLCVVDPGNRNRKKTLRITVPEDLDYEGVFDQVLDRYCQKWRLEQVRTTNMGSLFKLKYDVVLRRDARQKEMIDALRCHNGNLEITLAHPESEKNTEL